MIRFKKLAAMFQVLSVFAKLSAILAPWFLAVTDFFSTISAPVDVQPVCSSHYESLINCD